MEVCIGIGVVLVVLMVISERAMQIDKMNGQPMDAAGFSNVAVGFIASTIGLLIILCVVLATVAETVKRAGGM